jgi:hypothetical protein
MFLFIVISEMTGAHLFTHPSLQIKAVEMRNHLFIIVSWRGQIRSGSEPIHENLLEIEIYVPLIVSLKWSLFNCVVFMVTLLSASFTHLKLMFVIQVSEHSL